MTLQKRPAVLTGLAIAAFLMSISTTVIGLDLILLSPPDASPGSGEVYLAFPSRAVRVGLGLLTLLRTLLQIIAGVGLLRQSERWGRQVANLWGGLTLAQLVLSPLLRQGPPSPPLVLSGLFAVGVVAVVLVLLNRTFRAAFR